MTPVLESKKTKVSQDGQLMHYVVSAYNFLPIHQSFDLNYSVFDMRKIKANRLNSKNSLQFTMSQSVLKMRIEVNILYTTKLKSLLFVSYTNQ